GLHQRRVAPHTDRQRAALRALVPGRRGGPRHLLPGRMTPIDVHPFIVNWPAAMPGVVVVCTAIAVMLVDLLLRDGGGGARSACGIVGRGIAVALAMSAWSADADPSAFQHMLRADRYGLFFTIVVCVSAALTLLMSVEFVREWGLPAGDYYTLVLLSTAGMVFLALANDLIGLFRRL